jgi:hypothetical protein
MQWEMHSSERIFCSNTEHLRDHTCGMCALGVVQNLFSWTNAGSEDTHEHAGKSAYPTMYCTTHTRRICACLQIPPGQMPLRQNKKKGVVPCI